MRGDDFLDKMELVDSAFVEAADVSPISKKRSWVKWGAIAACLCLIVAILPISGLIQDMDKVGNIATLEYDGCMYEACDKGWILKKFGLPSKITADMAGEQLSYLESDGAGYKVASVKTNIELYQYAPFPCRAVYVLRDGENYMATLFCNFIHNDSNTCCELSTLYKIYGIDGAEDIASISHTDWNRRKVIGNTVTDTGAIAEFYATTTSLASYGSDDFQAEVFDGIPEEKQDTAHTAFADDNTTVRIETTSGIRFFIQFYPSYNWIFGDGTMSYYKMDDAMQAWFDSNIK